MADGRRSFSRAVRPGGAYQRDGTLSFSTNELFARLTRTEQELLKKYFEGHVLNFMTRRNSETLLKKYPLVFAP